jgi:hypothetical protein
MKKNLLRIITLVDIFGVPNSLLLARKLIHRSKLSGFVSLWIYLFVIIISSKEISRTLNK